MRLSEIKQLEKLATRIYRKLEFTQTAEVTAVDAAIKLLSAQNDPLENRAALAAIGFQEYGSNNRKFRFK